MHVLYEFDAYTWVNGGGGKNRFFASVWWVAPTPAVFFFIAKNRFGSGADQKPRVEWRVGEEKQEAVAQLLAGIAAGAIAQPLSDYLQESGAPEWVWKGVIDDPDWDDTVPWPVIPARNYENFVAGSGRLDLSAEQVDELVRQYESFGVGRFVPRLPDRIPPELPSEGDR